MKNGIYYLNNNGSRWVAYVDGQKEKITLRTKSGNEVTRKAIYYKSFGNFTSVCINYKGKNINVLTDAVLDD